MANFLYKKFLQAQLTDVNAVDFDADTIKAGLFRSSDYSPNQNSDDYLADAGVPIRSAVVTCTVSGDVVDADAFTFAMVPAGALIDVMVLYRDSGDPATSTLIAKYDVSITPDGGDVSVTVPDGGLFTLGNISVLSIAQGGTGQVSKGAAFDALAPGTTKGDLIGHDGADHVRVSVGADGAFLRANAVAGSGIEWAALSANDVPALDASKIATGTLDIARVPAISAANVSAGTFPAGAFAFTDSVSAPVISATNTSVATEGADVVTNGTFDADSDWTKGTGWTIGSGVATKTAGTASNLSQSLPGLAANQVVRIRFSYTRTAGTLTVSCGGVTHSTSFASASANADIYIRTTGTGALTFIANSTFAGTVDAVQANIITPRTVALDVPNVGTNNVALGANALENVTTGTGNLALGIGALQNNTTGQNTAIGFETLQNNTTGSSNTAQGHQALKNNTTGSGNTAQGHQALFTNTTGTNNTAQGELALFANTTGNFNVALGIAAIRNNTTGINNIAQGSQALLANTNGSNNVAQGHQTLRNATSISNCVALGYLAGRDETNSNRLYIHNSESTTPLFFGIFSGAGAGLTIHSQNTAGVPLIVKGIASQSSNLQQWQDSTGSVLAFVAADGDAKFVDVEIDGDLNHDGSNVGFYGTAPAAKGTVTGSRGGNAALESLLTALANVGLITDSSSA